jgi:integrase
VVELERGANCDYTDQDGKRHIKTFPTKNAATAWLDEAKVEVRRGIHTPDRSSVTVAEAARLWLRRCEVEGLERATIATYRYALNLHILPALGDIKLARMSAPAVETYRDELLSRVSRSRAVKVLSVLKSILADAMRRGLVAQNTASAVRVETRRRHEKRLEVGIQIPSKDDMNAILSAAAGRWRPLVVTAAFTGMRTSELRGLSWSDVDLENRVIHMRKRVDAYGQAGSPKSAAGRRDIPLSPTVVNALKEWWLACPKGPLMLVFPNTLRSTRTSSNGSGGLCSAI